VDLGATYNFHLWLIGKRVVDFQLVSIELFSLGVTAESLRAKIERKLTISLQRGHFDPKFQVRGDVSFHTKNFVADCLQAKCDFLRKSAVLRF